MKLTASKLRENVYSILDQVLETGLPIEIERKGKILRIVSANSNSKLARLPLRSIVQGDPEDLVDLDCSSEWRP